MMGFRGTLVMRVWALLLLVGLPASGWGASRPNIIFMLSDDQGWAGLSVAMHPDVPGSRGAAFNTPSLEKMASQGMRFSAAYSPAPVCSPTRISLQTGRTPAALHWTKAAPPETGRKLVEPVNIKNIPATETTIGELLRKAGYATAHYGKWHIRGGGPAQHAYDESDGDTGNEEAYKFKDPNPVYIFGMAKRAEAFMDKNRKAGKPFYIQLSWNALHAPGNALKATLAKYQKLGPGKNAERAAITEDLDTGVGMVLKSVDELGLSGDTFVIYMADNGAGGGKAALSGGKGDLYKGGFECLSSRGDPESKPIPGAMPAWWATTCSPPFANGPRFRPRPCPRDSRVEASPDCCPTGAGARSSAPARRWFSIFPTTRATRPTRRFTSATSS